MQFREILSQFSTIHFQKEFIYVHGMKLQIRSIVLMTKIDNKQNMIMTHYSLLHI